eukprot:296698-Amphidinium_carterae.1
MLKDLKEEEEAALRSAEATTDAADAALIAASQQSLSVDDQENPVNDPLETGTVAEGLSPRNLDDVQVDDPALETHAAQ